MKIKWDHAHEALGALASPSWLSWLLQQPAKQVLFYFTRKLRPEELYQLVSDKARVQTQGCLTPEPAVLDSSVALFSPAFPSSVPGPMGVGQDDRGVLNQYLYTTNPEHQFPPF